jgi:hypothetical protein
MIDDVKSRAYHDMSDWIKARDHTVVPTTVYVFRQVVEMLQPVLYFILSLSHYITLEDWGCSGLNAVWAELICLGMV